MLQDKVKSWKCKTFNLAFLTEVIEDVSLFLYFNQKSAWNKNECFQELAYCRISYV
jgi:hypothetical protein